MNNDHCPHCSEADARRRIGLHRHWLWPHGYSHFGADVVDAHPGSLPAKVARAARFGQYELADVSLPNVWRYWAFNTGACAVLGGEHCQWFETPAEIIDDAAAVLELDNAILAAWPGIYFARALMSPDGQILAWAAVVHRYVLRPHETYVRPGYTETITDPQQHGGSDQGIEGRDKWGL